MNMKIQCSVAIVAAMLFATSPSLSDEEYLILTGPGASSCGKLTAEIEVNESARAAFFFWAQGYMSGLNLKYTESLESIYSATNLTDYDALRLWIENYCEENPLDLYAVAAGKLWVELRFRQGLDTDTRFKPKD